jgi:hypothetical protein
MRDLAFPHIFPDLLAVGAIADLERVLEAICVGVAGPLEDHDECLVVHGLWLVCAVLIWERE